MRDSCQPVVEYREEIDKKQSVLLLRVIWSWAMAKMPCVGSPSMRGITSGSCTASFLLAAQVRYARGPTNPDSEYTHTDYRTALMPDELK